MITLFYTASAIAIVATLLAITRAHAVHALLYVVVSLLAMAAIFFTLGAPFIAALEIIIYAGAIIVLFLFVVMLLGLGPGAVQQERAWIRPRIWLGPSALGLLLLIQLLAVVWDPDLPPQAIFAVGAEAVSMLLFGPYLLGVEIASMLLLAALVTAYHLARREPKARSASPLIERRTGWESRGPVQQRPREVAAE